MKTNKLFAGLVASGLALAGLSTSCVSDAPFGYGDGDGSLRMRLVVNSNLTRAEVDDRELEDKCVVYISRVSQDAGLPSGLIYKCEGLDNLAEELQLRSGNYVAEAWTGDSVPASFTDKFYRGYMPFQILGNQPTDLTLECRIANVAVSVDQATVNPDFIKEWKVTVSNSSGSLDYDAETATDAIGYFMMPDADLVRTDDGAILKGEDNWSLYTNLRYTVEGVAADGSRFSKSGLIGRESMGKSIVEHAHHYVLAFEYLEDEDKGGAFIDIRIQDNWIEENHQVGLFSRPSIKGSGFDITHQVVENAGSLTDKIIRIGAFNGIRSIQITSPDSEVGLPVYGVDLIKIAPDEVDNVKGLGLDWDYQQKASDVPSTCIVTFKSEFLNRIPERPSEYVIHILVTDGNNRTNEADLRLALDPAAVIPDAQVEFDPIDSDSAPMAVLARQATISGSVVKDAVNPVLRYRRMWAAEWSTVDIQLTRASDKFSVTLTDLEPGTAYEYQAAAEGWEGDVMTFTTESPFDIPDADMETWSTHTDKAVFPGSDYSKNFWDSGNHGSATLGSTQLTTQSYKMTNANGSCAELKSQFVGFGSTLGAFAAGNLFVGKFGSTVGMSGAQLQFGQPFNGSHPEKLTVMASYTPGVVDYTKTNCPHAFTKNKDYDHGQIYVAICTDPILVNTGTQDKNGVKAGTYMDYDNDERVIGFGEVTWKDGESFGTPTSLSLLEIPITWRPDARTKKAAYVIITCSASKYGDYFTGSTKSLLYVDDFKFEY